MGEKRNLLPLSEEQGAPVRDLAARERILETTLRVLSRVGYARATVGGIAQEAGVGKATVYRSWPHKAALTLDAVRTRLPDIPVDDLGDSPREILAVAQALAGLYGAPQVRAILPALISDAATDPELARRLRTELIEPRRDRSATVLRRAVTRGVLPADTDVLTLLDMWAGLMLFRGIVLDGDLDERGVQALVSAALASPPRVS
ncbi:TetR/AcrR family transcriptional regulator [Kitasatospora sp. NPDC048407]|uniref:TetR/AcrR family transcriptional regulator n=1 Tax=Kitasatospora sp. NPDC048407 TaxID=3364051 RepID=UPI0037201923